MSGNNARSTYGQSSELLLWYCIYCRLVNYHAYHIKSNSCSTDNINSLKPSDAYIYVRKLANIGSDNGLSPDWRQAII